MQNTQTINKNDFIYKPLVLHPKWNKPVKYPVHSHIWRHQFFIKYSYQILQQYPVLQNNFKISLWMLLLKKKNSPPVFIEKALKSGFVILIKWGKLMQKSTFLSMPLKWSCPYHACIELWTLSYPRMKTLLRSPTQEEQVLKNQN